MRALISVILVLSTLVVNNINAKTNHKKLTADTTHIEHNGYTYKIVTSPYTGKRWLNKNIGAARACLGFYDEFCFGDYFQWGRNADGHEKKDSSTTTILAKSFSNPGNYFITAGVDDHQDWAVEIDRDKSKRRLRWSKIDGSSICPKGFRVPTILELKKEIIEAEKDQYIKTAFNSFLKLPSAGMRNYVYGDFYDRYRYSFYWATSDSDSVIAHLVITESGSIYTYNSGNPSHGKPVRCIKD